MDLSDPTRAVTGQLDGTVLAVLANAGSPLTAGQVAERAPRGSEIGIRRSLTRLAHQGLVRATLMGRNQVHELNREHVAADIAVQLAALRTELWRRFRDNVADWSHRPIYAAIFGSAARGDGDIDSDIDLLVVHPPTVSGVGLGAPGWIEAIDMFSFMVGNDGWADAEPGWQSQIDTLRRASEAWTGNPLQVVDLSVVQWCQPDSATEELLATVAREGIELVKPANFDTWSARRNAHA